MLAQPHSQRYAAPMSSMEMSPVGASSPMAHFNTMAATEMTLTGGLSSTSDAGSPSSVFVSSCEKRSRALRVSKA
jgi:hypothetical protein